VLRSSETKIGIQPLYIGDYAEEYGIVHYEIAL
jgi:hypothetical protein